MTYATTEQLKALQERLTREEARRKAADEVLSGRLVALEEPASPSTFAPDIFYGDSLAAFSSNGALIQPSSAVALVNAPDGSGDRVWSLTVDNGTGTFITPDPRAELLGPSLKLREFWWGGATCFPETFPGVTGWWNIAEGPYGPPFNGSPPVEIDLRSSGVGWHTNSHGGNKDVWRRPLVLGRKHTWLIHVVLSSAPEVKDGGVEMWWDGEQVCSVQNFPTWDASNQTGPQHCMLQSYRQLDTVKSPVTIYHWPMALGTKRELVEYR